MEIEFLKHRGVYAPGSRTDRIAPGVAAELIRRRIARAVTPAAPADPPAAAPVPAVRPPTPGGRKRGAR